MPDIDRDAMNRALAEKLGDEHAYDHWALPDGVHRTPKEFRNSLDAAVAALNALGLGWQRFYADGWHLAVGPRDVLAGPWLDSLYPDDLAAPAALATALVQAALQVLGEEETGDLG